MEGDEPLPWFRGGLSFECTQCGDCCSGPSQGFVWVDDSEIAAIAAVMGMSDRIDEFERKFVRDVRGRKSLVEYSDGDCIFLDPALRRCTVYAARPLQCRSWPFWEKNLAAPRSWAAAAAVCPGCNRGQRYDLVQITTLKTAP